MELDSSTVPLAAEMTLTRSDLGFTFHNVKRSWDIKASLWPCKNFPFEEEQSHSI